MTFNFLVSPEPCKKVVQGLWKTSNWSGFFGSDKMASVKNTRLFCFYRHANCNLIQKKLQSAFVFLCTQVINSHVPFIQYKLVMKDLALRRRKSLYFYTAFSREKIWFRNRIWLTWKCQVQNKWRQNIIKIIFDLFQLRIYRQLSRTSQSSKVSFSSSQKRGLCKLRQNYRFCSK